MRVLSESSSDGVLERHFVVGDAPGILWSADDGTDDGTAGPLMLVGHGGGQHKRAPTVVGRATRFVAAGFTVVTLDAPGHGDRPKDDGFAARLRRLRAAGEPVTVEVERNNAALAGVAVPEWRAALDALGARGPVGYWGASLGCAIGVPLVADEPRIGAAVLGLFGHETLAATAARITVPVEFLLQWDDELIPRESGLALFDAFGSVEKTLHANPGRHAEVPGFETESAVRFFARHLGAG